MVIYMEKAEKTSVFIQKKGFHGYTENLSQYTGEGANVVVNHHSNDYMNFHTHDFLEINYILSGQCSNLFESGSVDMQEGDFILIHPDSMHSLFVDNTSRVYNFLVSKAFIFDFFSKIKNCENTNFFEFIKRIKKENAPAYLLIKGSSETTKIATSMLGVEKHINKSMYLECLLGQLLLTCAKNTDNAFLSEATIEGKDVLKNIFTKMESEYQTVSLDTIAKDFGYSKTYICVLFKKHYNSTFSAKLNEIKILHAKKLLIDTNMSIADISYKLGFESIEYFHRLFKKTCGETPNSYRKNQNNI